MSAKLESIAQLAKRIGKSERQVRGWIENALIRHNRIGGKIEIPEGAYEEMLQATEIVPSFKHKKTEDHQPRQQPPKRTTEIILNADMLEKLAAEF